MKVLYFQNNVLKLIEEDNINTISTTFGIDTSINYLLKIYNKQHINLSNIRCIVYFNRENYHRFIKNKSAMFTSVIIYKHEDSNYQQEDIEENDYNIFKYILEL